VHPFSYSAEQVTGLNAGHEEIKGQSRGGHDRISTGKRLF